MATTADRSRSHELHRLGVICGLAAGAWLGAAEAPDQAGHRRLLAVPDLARHGGRRLRRALDRADPAQGHATHRLGRPAGRSRTWSCGRSWPACSGRWPTRSPSSPSATSGSPSPSRCGTRTAWSACSGAGCCSTNCAAPAAGMAPRSLGGAAADRRRGVPARLRHVAPGGGRGAEAPPWASSRPSAAGLLWGTMYIPYRKAYISGMNPLSFVTVFTFGELATVRAAGPGVRGRPRRAPAAARRGAAGALLALPRRLLLGARRPLPAVRREVHRHRPRHPALEHQPAVGPRVGRAGLRRTARRRTRRAGARGRRARWS